MAEKNKKNSSSEKNQCHLCILGTRDFVRRMSVATKEQETYGLNTEIVVHTANLADARALILSEKPEIIVVDVGINTSNEDVKSIRSLLEQCRERFNRDLHIILAITAPEKFAIAGNLFFKEGIKIEPSLLLDNVIVTPPPGIPTALSLEGQLQDCLSCVVEIMEANGKNVYNLPALWEDSWVPIMCDPESRNVWIRWLPRYARYTNENPIIVGPTGSGKTRLAAAIHKLSGRKGPFISITPRDFSSNELVQAELFGAVAGAYTGAVDKWGLVKRAEKGTLFIDELQSIDRDLQGKLITFIENKSYRRVGEAESNSADVRFVFATNRPLQSMVSDGSLRDDFAYRLERLKINLSPLHHRRLDIAAGISFTLAKVLRERAEALATSAPDSLEKVAIEGLTTGAYQILYASMWPGNLRQLENTVAKLVELTDIKKLKIIDKESTSGILDQRLGQTELTSTDIFEKAAINVAIRARSEGFEGLEEFVATIEENARLTALEFCGGDIDEAADLINDSTKKLELFVKNYK
jgi:transcriptional regulator with AAA-type ATPase domain